MSGRKDGRPTTNNDNYVRKSFYSPLVCFGFRKKKTNNNENEEAPQADTAAPDANQLHHILKRVTRRVERGDDNNSHGDDKHVSY